MTRRQLIAIGGLAFASACHRAKARGYPGYLLVANAGDDSVSAVDLRRFQLSRTIQLGASPAAVVPAGSDARSFVLTPRNGTVHIVDSELRLAGARRLAAELSGIHFDPRGNRLLAISGSGHELIEADGQSLRVTGRHTLDGEPLALDVSSTGSVAVSTGGHGSVHLFTPGGQHVKAQLGGAVGDLRFRADGKLLLVANLQGRCLTALDPATLKNVADLPLAMKPQNLCFNADQGQLFISGPGMDGIAIVFPYQTIQVDQTVLAGRDPGVMVCSEAPAYLFVASNSGSDICILDVNTRKVIGLVDAGERPTYLTVTPDSQYTLILDRSAGMLAVIHIAELQRNLTDAFKMRYRSGASLFAMIPVGSEPVHAAIMPIPA
jgi:DNA-binding beta-propeller fold protein YncE